MYIRNPHNIALLYFETYFQKIGIFQSGGGMGWDPKMGWYGIGCEKRYEAG